MTFRLRVIRLPTFDEDRREDTWLAYWLTRPIEGRLAAVEFLRREFHGSGVRIGSHQIPILGREALLRNERAAGRPKDLADIDALTRGEE